MKKIPKGWTDFKPYGDKVEGTKLLPLKTPLKQELVEGRIPKEQWFTPAFLTSNCPQLKAIIDLTDTDRRADRYYNPQEFIDANVEHIKIRIKGGGLVPGRDQMKSFSDAVDGFVKKFSDNPDALIGVHCTHGLNRTGYFICKYMVTRMHCEPQVAIAEFQKARGYEMYRQNFIDEIIRPGRTRKQQRPDYNRRPTYVARPVEALNVQQDNWRLRDQESLPRQEPEPNWQVVQSRPRRNRYEHGRSTSRRMQSTHSAPMNRGFSRTEMEYRSPLDNGYEGYEEIYGMNRYRSPFQRDRNKRT